MDAEGVEPGSRPRRGDYACGSEGRSNHVGTAGCA